MRCNYPNCQAQALFLPVIELPTIRTKGVTPPHKPDPALFKPGSYAYHTSVKIYEQALAEVATREKEISNNTKPTYMMMREVCQAHRDSYRFQDWFKVSEWEYVREAARSKGFAIPEITLIAIAFKPIGWMPTMEYMELQRDKMKPE